MAHDEKTMAVQACSRLREDLIGGHLAPGEKLKVHDLATRYGVGASPIREALSSLVPEGLVERFDQRGFRAAKVTVAEYDELVFARCLLESLVLRESIGSGDSIWEERLLVASYRLARLERSEPSLVSPKVEEAHLAFHSALVGACASPTLLGICSTLRERANRYRNIAGIVDYPARDTAAEHAALAQAALDRDADKAVRLLSEHYGQTAVYLRTALASAIAP